MAFFPTFGCGTLAGRTSSVLWKPALVSQALSVLHIACSRSDTREDGCTALYLRGTQEGSVYPGTSFVKPGCLLSHRRCLQTLGEVQ